MAKHGSKDSSQEFKTLYKDLALMRDAREGMKISESARNYDNKLSNLTETINKIAQTKDVKKAIAIEEICLQHEATYFTNSKEQADSLKTALAQVPAAKNIVKAIENKQTYKEFAIDGFGKKAKCRDGLPNDGAREFFSSQKSRLTNMLKGLGFEAEKDFLKARHNMLDTAEKTYASEQRRALGLEEEKVKPEATKTMGKEKASKAPSWEVVRDGFEERLATSNMSEEQKQVARERLRQGYDERISGKTSPTQGVVQENTKAPAQDVKDTKASQNKAPDKAQDRER